MCKICVCIIPWFVYHHHWQEACSCKLVSTILLQFLFVELKNSSYSNSSNVFHLIIEKCWGIAKFIHKWTWYSLDFNKSKRDFSNSSLFFLIITAESIIITCLIHRPLPNIFWTTLKIKPGDHMGKALWSSYSQITTHCILVGSRLMRPRQSSVGTACRCHYDLLL